MRTIHKYRLQVADEQFIEWPAFSTPLCVQMQSGGPAIWADVETTQTPEKRRIVIKGTGHPFDEEMDGDLAYLGTFQTNNGQFVWHTYVDCA